MSQSWTPASEYEPDHPTWVPPSWLRITVQHARLAAKGYASRETFETILAAWCNLCPALRGRGADCLVHLFDQHEQYEREAIDRATWKVIWAVRPLLEADASTATIEDAAQRAADSVLTWEDVMVILRVELARSRHVHRRRA